MRGREREREKERENEKYLVALTSGKARRLLEAPPSATGAKARHDMKKQTIKACNVFIFCLYTRLYAL